MQATRRQFIKSGLASALVMSLSPKLAFAENSAHAISIGFQLYTVRGEFSRDVPGTLNKIGQLGYKGVEFWGYGGTPNVYQHYSATDLRKLLDQSGLTCCGIHMELKALAKENLERTINNGRELGLEYLNVAAAQDGMRAEKTIGDLAAQLNEAAVQCAPHKMTVGYHAHPFDFAKLNGQVAWQIPFRQTSPEVNMQMDVGNCLAGNGDPIAMLKEFPGRTRTIHIKEHEAKTFESDFYKEIFYLCETTSRTKWYIVEMGSPEGDGFDIPREALTKLHRLGK
jgi:sugar phosphate isomerase/epimerase